MFIFAVSNLRGVLGPLMQGLPKCATAFTDVDHLLSELEGELLALSKEYAQTTGWMEPGWKKNNAIRTGNRPPIENKRKTLVQLLSSSDDEPESEALTVPERKMPGQELFDSTKEVLKVHVRAFVAERNTPVKVKDTLEWWSQNAGRWPMIAAVARHSLCVPASSATSERSFSKTGHIVRARRARLGDERIRQLTFLSWNPDL